ncbi:TPA: serine hydrolase [Pseudomonas aeruginosa]|nr:serine hydrolase [Pseudomonas aeruginosa]HBP4590180.1 serine hydrolase [Pseudomonas aeruginosa]HBP4856593.1 serine hydrolase [Pseudomonas aeruginosa]
MRSCISVFRPALLALFVSASGSAGADAAVENPRIGRAADLYELIPEYQPDTYRNMDKVYPTRVIHKGTKVRPLPAGVAIAPRYRIGGEEYGVDDFMRRNRVGGVLVLKDGKVALERYGLGNDERTRWTSFSVVKSISSPLVGAAVQQGLLALDQPVDKYLPSLAGSAYQGVTVEQVLQMSSGVRWNETYRDPKSDRRQMFDAQLAERPGGILRLLASLPRQYPSGTHFTYSTGESHLQSELLHAATRIPVSDYLSERIWARMGMESDGFWQLESPAGQEIGSSGLSATLRDYGRFGQFVLEDGVIDGERILPEGWVDRASRVEASSHLAPGKLYDGEYALGYGYQWWTFPVGAKALPEHDGGAFEAQGIFGQYLYINRKEKIVAVVWSAWPKPEMDDREEETYAFLGAAVKALR